jgi:hypothetical protein
LNKTQLKIKIKIDFFNWVGPGSMQLWTEPGPAGTVDTTVSLVSLSAQQYQVKYHQE